MTRLSDAKKKNGHYGFYMFKIFQKQMMVRITLNYDILIKIIFCFTIIDLLSYVYKLLKKITVLTIL